jgi:phenylacetic acid degradation protein
LIFKYKGYIPVIHETAYVHPQASVIGNVVIGKDVYIGPGARLRGDFGKIIIQDECNVQENCTIHMFPGKTVILEKRAHVGHGAIIHGAHLGENCLIGMNAVIMDHVKIGNGSIVGALAFIPEGTIIPDRKIAVGNPFKIVKDVSDEMLGWKTEGTSLYSSLPLELYKSLKEVEPLRKEPENQKEISDDYSTWGKRK